VGAVDIMGAKLVDSILFRVDRTPPELAGISLSKGSEHGLFVHDSGDLSLMDVSFEASDIHSGLMELRWTITESDGPEQSGGTVIATAALAAATMTFPCAPDCKCVGFDATRCYKRFYDLPLASHGPLHPSQHTSGHGSDIWITVEVKNRANLWATKKANIKIDLSPPVAGVVLDSLPSQPDLDYVSSEDQLRFSVKGFADPESGWSGAYLSRTLSELASLYAFVTLSRPIALSSHHHVGFACNTNKNNTFAPPKMPSL